MSPRLLGLSNRLHGTLPVVPISNRFIGTIHSNGLTVKVVSLAVTYAGQVLFMSGVGNQNAAASIMSTLISNKNLGLEADGDIDWGGPETLSRLPNDNYKQDVKIIPGTKEVNHIILAQGSINIKQAMTVPLVMPEPESGPILLLDRYVLGNEAVICLDPPDKTDLTPIYEPKDEVYIDEHGKKATRKKLRWYLDQNGEIVLEEEYTPHRRSFLAQLQALHILVLQHPDYVDEWADQLWTSGLQQNLIREMPACGLRAWRVDGNVTAWNNLIRDGLRDGILQWPGREDNGIRITKKSYVPPMQQSDVELQREAMNDALSIFAGSH